MLTRPQHEPMPNSDDVRREADAFDWSHIDALSDEEIERRAREDEENPEWTDEELARAQVSRRVRLLVRASGLGHDGFARRYHLDADELAAFIDGSAAPSPAMLAYLAVIDREPEAVARALAAAEAA